MIKSWDEEYSDEETISFVSDLALVHAERLASSNNEGIKAVGQCFASCITTGAIASLLNFDLDYSNPIWADTNALKDARQCLAYFSKLSILDIGIDKQQAAMVTFEEAELKCAQTNRTFERWSSGDFAFTPDVEAVLHGAQRKIAKVLGKVPDLSDLALRFGPGANAGIPKRVASVRSKLNAKPSCSTNLLPYVSTILAEMPHYTTFHSIESREHLDENGEVDIVETVAVEIKDGTISFVPKSPKTFRTIGVEPLLNSVGQLAYGDYIAKRLNRWGVDLRDQGVNQRRALEGSLTGALATLDLSSASDTISFSLVAHLLPLDWYTVLTKYRTAVFLMPDGSRERLEKFSSMGNGFTFPLESLIFWALASSASDELVTVYGDDIICAVKDCDLIVKVLEACGFTINKSKSFWSGPFRESCGSDYYRGIDIRPVYVKTRISGIDLFRLHNHFFRVGDDELRRKVLGAVPESLKLWGPSCYGDGHLHCSDPLNQFGRDRGWSGYTFDTYTFKARRDFRALPGDCILPTYCIYRRGVTETLSVSPEVYMSLVSAAPYGIAYHDYYSGSPVTYFSEGLKGQARIDVLMDPLPEKAKGSTRSKGVTLPGKRGYKRISIYTLAP